MYAQIWMPAYEVAKSAVRIEEKAREIYLASPHLHPYCIRAITAAIKFCHRRLHCIRTHTPKKKNGDLPGRCHQ